MTQDSRRGRQRTRLTATVTDLSVVRQRAYLVGVVLDGEAPGAAELSLDELALLTDTAGSDPVEQVLVRRDRPEPGTFIGRGKAAEIAADIKAFDIDVAVFDNELTPAQQRNLMQIFGCDVVDRVALILDIFAQHATSREGMVQVELAQHRYRLPRLRGQGTALSRLGGGIGTRGPGETKLETDRRRILERISKLERSLKELRQTRATQRKARRRAALPVIAIVGYTNAGKSTLFNRLTEADVLVEDRLFATLDSTVRRLELRSTRPAALSDTVGFVRRLPHQLVEAFRSTLEEVTLADLLLHVVDASDPDPDRQIEAVRAVLGEIGAGEIRELIVINKADVAEATAVERLAHLHPESAVVSALTGHGIDDLLDAIDEQLRDQKLEVKLLVPHSRGDALAALHRVGEILEQHHDAGGTEVRVRLAADQAHRFAPFVV